MENNKEERNVNVVLKNDSDNNKDVIVTLSGIISNIKKYFLVWVVAAVVAFVLPIAGSAIFSADQHKEMTALVSFTYSGIEKGKDPNGNVFNANSIKAPDVIEAALTKLNHPLKELEIIRKNIKIEGLVPSDTIDRLTVYNGILETGTSGTIQAAEQILETSYYPTQFTVKFNYADTSYSNAEAVEVFNTILECYRDYFFEKYGYNEALGSAVSTIGYTDYDYAEAVDLFNSTLSTLRSYVNALSREDTTRFRSSVTGYTFADLSKSIEVIQSMDLDLISSYITVNNVTKDKAALIDYYKYRIDSLTRQKTVAEENLAVVTASIEAYEKDTVMIFGNGTENTDTQYSQGSETYNNLFQKRINAQNEVSTITQQISFYTTRMNTLNSKPAGNSDEKERVEADLAKINEKITALIEQINLTSDEYYNTVSFANAYNILVPASTSSVVRTLKDVIKDSIIPIFVLEALLVAGYLCVVLVSAMLDENKKKNGIIAVSDNSEKTDDSKKKK